MIGARVSQNNFETPQLLLVSPMGKRPTLGVDGYLDGWMDGWMDGWNEAVSYVVIIAAIYIS